MKHTRKEQIKLELIRGVMTEKEIKEKYGTTSNFIKECKVDLKHSNSLTKIDKKL